MRRRFKYALFLIIAASLGVTATLLASAHYRHKLKRTITKAEITWAKWRGKRPRLLSISGRVDSAGLQVEALDSRSGWAALSDKEGNFVLPDVMWYPGASYELVVSSDETRGRLNEISAPKQFPDGGLYNVGSLDLSTSREVDLSNLPGRNSVTYTDYDLRNRDYYKETFDRLTNGKSTDEEKVAAINDYVATRFDAQSTRWERNSPRQILEQGSAYCGHLSAAMETLLVTGDYQAREIYMMDGKDPVGSHIVVEVFYGGAWRLYDPMFGAKVQNQVGAVASYRELRLNSGLISDKLFPSVEAQNRPRLLALLVGLYDSGYHHIFQIKKP